MKCILMKCCTWFDNSPMKEPTMSHHPKQPGKDGKKRRGAASIPLAIILALCAARGCLQLDNPLPRRAKPAAGEGRGFP